MIWLALTLALGCKHGHEVDGYAGRKIDGTKGAVCQWGEQAMGGPLQPSQPLPEPAHCAIGLSCCYPCGIFGCDHQCATPSECASWQMLP